jgi:hypothetical protein
MEFLIVIGAVLWVIGFFRVGRTVEDGLLVNRTFARPPRFIYLICGLPKSQNIPPGTMAIPSLFLQLHGLLLIICGLITVLVTQNIFLVGCLYILGLVLLIKYIIVLYKNNAYKMDSTPNKFRQR